MSKEFTDDEIEQAGLTDDEIEALQDDDIDEEETADKNEGDDTTDNDTDSDADSTGDDDADDSDDDSDDADVDDAGTDDTGDKEEESEKKDDADQDVKPETQAETDKKPVESRSDAGFDIDSAKDRMSAIDAEMIELGQKLDDGDISAREFSERNVALQNEKSSLDRSVVKAEDKLETAETTWRDECKTFLDAPENALYSNKLLKSTLNEAVMEVARDESLSKLTGIEVLQEADRRVRKLMGQAIPDEAKKETGKSTKAQDELKRRSESKKGMPKTLAGIPSADESDSGGEFAELERLDGIEAEEAFARMPKDKQDRYLATQN